MKKFDIHVHLRNTNYPAEFIEKLENGGIYGACIFSNPPLEYATDGMPFEERLDRVLKFVATYPNCQNRLFPVLWVHPDEPNIIDKIELACKKGIVAFKIICNNFFVYEEKSMNLIKKIAEHNKPIFFHSGILWDGAVSSAYNRPVNFEHLIGIKGLKFSLGHCSWPWIDECIALYGKFLNASIKNDTAKMYFDLTPGTPEIYREELLTKLFNIGYDVSGNIMFGTDCRAETYSSNWAKKWLEIDRNIMDTLGVSKEIREKLYNNNLIEFLGINQNASKISAPTPDNSNSWSPVNSEVAVIIEKWYKRLGFNSFYDSEFYSALKKVKISDAITIENYDANSQDGIRNLLSYLYMCEALSCKYNELGIDESILIDTLKDIVRWTDIWSSLKGGLYLGELSWLNCHLSCKLFKIGRLQYCRDVAYCDIEELGVKAGDKVLAVHIPAGESMNVENCKKSLELAREFFAKYYPDYDYKCFTCDSWLLDPTLNEVLDEKSNIISFANLFKIISTHPADSIFRYIFNWNCNRNNLKEQNASSAFAKQIKKLGLEGKTFYKAYGYILK